MERIAVRIPKMPWLLALVWWSALFHAWALGGALRDSCRHASYTTLLGLPIWTDREWVFLPLANHARAAWRNIGIGCQIMTANLWVGINWKMLPYCESTEAFVWGKRQKIIADSCQEFQEEWWGPCGSVQQWVLFSPLPQLRQDSPRISYLSCSTVSFENIFLSWH